MALIKCPECGETVSDKAAACIRCGFPIRTVASLQKENDISFNSPLDEAEQASITPDECAVTKETILEYLKHAISLESASLGEQTIIEDFKKTTEINKPVCATAKQPSAPYEAPVPEHEETDTGYLAMACMSLGVAAIIIILLFALGIFIGLLFFVAIGFAIAGFIMLKKHMEFKSEVTAIIQQNSERRQKYREECERAEEKNRQYAFHHRELIEEWEHSSETNLKYLVSKHSETIEVLLKYYEPDLIFPKYRNLPALTSIYEYLTSGRCKELTGSNGAYNLYEMELRQNTVISQLNTIITDLEQIRQNQFMLYQELTKITDSTSQIANEISQIKGYTYSLTELAALNTYYAAVTAESTAALAFSATL